MTAKSLPKKKDAKNHFHSKRKRSNPSNRSPMKNINWLRTSVLIVIVIQRITCFFYSNLDHRNEGIKAIDAVVTIATGEYSALRLISGVF